MTAWEQERDRRIEELFAEQARKHAADPLHEPLYPPADTDDEWSSTEAYTAGGPEEPGS
jgi:hypothetical protein